MTFLLHITAAFFLFGNSATLKHKEIFGDIVGNKLINSTKELLCEH